MVETEPKPAGGDETPAATAIQTIELETEKPGAPPPKELPPAPPSKKYDPAEHRERARQRLAETLVGILALIVLFSFLTLWWSTVSVKSSDLKDLLSILLAPIATLAGSAIGFYFGGKGTDEGSGS